MTEKQTETPLTPREKHRQRQQAARAKLRGASRTIRYAETNRHIKRATVAVMRTEAFRRFERSLPKVPAMPEDAGDVLRAKVEYEQQAIQAANHQALTGFIAMAIR